VAKRVTAAQEKRVLKTVQEPQRFPVTIEACRRVLPLDAADWRSGAT